MSGVFQNIDPPSPHRPASVYPPPLVRGERGWGFKSSVNARHCSVLYLCKYFVYITQPCAETCYLLGFT
jgi:hypothetical protein